MMHPATATRPPVRLAGGNGAPKAWSRRLRILAVAALALAVVIPAVAALEGWQIDAAGLIGWTATS